MDYAKKDYDVSSTELVTFFLFTIDYFLMQPYSCFQIISHDNCYCFSQSNLVEDVKALFKVLFMFLPLPVFWTLFDQQVRYFIP